jgi:hypothetical protein
MKPEKKYGKPRKSQKILPYTKINLILLIVGFAFIGGGYLALSVKPWSSFASMSIAPIMLVVGYCVVLPIAILYHKREAAPETTAPAAPAPPQPVSPPA